MGLIKAALGAAGGVLADQWKEYFYCEAISENVMAVKGQHRVSGRSSNNKGSENIISNGSVVAVADGQCMMIVDQGKVTELCAEPGEFVYDSSTEPSIFSGELGAGILNTFENIGKRFTFGGEPPKDQRVYYFNTKELIGNKYGTPSPVPFRVVDQRAGIDIDIAIRCFGEYSYRICDPILFYTNVCGNVGESYTRDRLDGQLKTELLTALQPAFAKISDMGIRYSALPGHTMELADALNEVLSGKWRNLRGLEIVSFGVSSVKAGEEDEAMLKEMQRNAAFMDPTRAAAHLVGRAGGGNAVRGSQSECRSRNGFHGYEYGWKYGRYECAGPLSNGCAAAHTARLSSTRSAARRTGWLELFLRSDRNHGEVLPRVRRKKARAEAYSRWLEVSAVRHDGGREILPRMRHKKAGSAAGWLDVQLRCSKQRKILCRMRQTEAGRCSAVQVRQMRLGTG